MAISARTYISKSENKMNTSRILTFLHSGDAGDIVASLATVKEICEYENSKALLLLDTSGGTTCNDDELNKIIYGQTKGKGLKFNDKAYDFLVPMIEIQPYIAKVEKWNSNLQVNIDYNLNKFRKAFVTPEIAKKTNQNLMFLHQNACGLDFRYNGPWLFYNKQDDDVKHEIIISRSPRVHSAYAFFAIYEDLFKNKAEFIGLDFEYDLFKETFRYQPKRYPVKSALDMLRAIANANQIIVNSTLLYWIAVGYGHQNIIHEMPIDVPTSYFPNQNPATIHYVQGAHFIK